MTTMVTSEKESKKHREKFEKGLPKPFELLWCRHRYEVDNVPQSYKRVWQGTWGPEKYEILSAQEFSSLEHLCLRLSIPLVEAPKD